MENGDSDTTPEKNHDPYFEPIISLPEVKIPTLEEEENILICLRAKLYRMERSTKEWKERGTGEVKLLHNPNNKTVRIVMRRDKTLKICANHFLTRDMVLKPSSNSERAWVWTTMADFTDQSPKVEILAIMFLNPEIAKKWKVAFEDAQDLLTTSESERNVPELDREGVRDSTESDTTSSDEDTLASDSSNEDDDQEIEQKERPTSGEEVLSEEIKKLEIKSSDTDNKHSKET